MKIIVNKEEIYQISLPDSIHIDQLDFLVTRLSKLVKLFGSEKILVDTPEQTIDNKSNDDVKLERVTTTKGYNMSREDIIKVARVYYDKNLQQEFKEIFIKKNTGYTKKKFGYAWHHMKHKYNIKPSEVGITKYPGGRL